MIVWSKRSRRYLRTVVEARSDYFVAFTQSDQHLPQFLLYFPLYFLILLRFLYYLTLRWTERKLEDTLWSCSRRELRPMISLFFISWVNRMPSLHLSVYSSCTHNEIMFLICRLAPLTLPWLWEWRGLLKFKNNAWKEKEINVCN